MTSQSCWARILSSALLMTVLTAVGCATQRTPDAERTQLRTLRTELIARADADSLAAAALFERFATGQWQEAAALAARAVAAAPDRTDLVFLQLVLCYQMPDCAPEPLESRLRALDPTNGITWLYVLARATRDHDDAVASTALAGLADAQRVGLYWNSLVFHLTKAVVGRAGFDERSALEEVVGLQDVFISPPLQPVAKACPAQAPAIESVLVQCRRIFSAFDHSDTELLQSFANDLGDRLWPHGSAEHAAFTAKRRAMDYRQSLWETKPILLSSATTAGTLLRLYGQYPTEQEAFLALYASLGISPDPPRWWQEPAEIP